MGFCLKLSKGKVHVVSAAVVHVAVDEQQHVLVLDELAEGLAACVDRRCIFAVDGSAGHRWTRVSEVDV